jgi:hypothetical protein
MAIILNNIIKVLENQLPEVSKHISFELKEESDTIDTPIGLNTEPITGRRKVTLCMSINVYEVSSVKTLTTILTMLKYCGLSFYKVKPVCNRERPKPSTWFVYSLDVTDMEVYYTQNELYHY